MRHTLACVIVITTPSHHQKDKPTVRIELTTFCLQNRCTTTVLCRQADPKEKLRIEQDAIWTRAHKCTAALMQPRNRLGTCPDWESFVGGDGVGVVVYVLGWWWWVCMGVCFGVVRGVVRGYGDAGHARGYSHHDEQLGSVTNDEWWMMRMLTCLFQIRMILFTTSILVLYLIQTGMELTTHPTPHYSVGDARVHPSLSHRVAIMTGMGRVGVYVIYRICWICWICWIC